MPNVLWQSEIFAVAGLDYFKKTLPLVKLVHRQLEPMREEEVVPFKKVGPNQYQSPSGKIWTKAQITAYEAKKTGKR